MISRRRFCELASVGAASISLPSILRAEANPRPSITVVGIGGGGIDIVEKLRGQLPPDRNISTYTASWSPNPKRMVDLDFATGFSNPPSSVQAECIAGVVEQADTMILVAGIGGKGATDLTYQFASAAKETRARVVSVLVLPFPGEWKRVPRAQKAGNEIAGISDQTVFIDNSWVGSPIPPKVSIASAIDGVNAVVVSLVSDMIRTRSTPVALKL
jgi:cell division GTPase FtsZ